MMHWPSAPYIKRKLQRIIPEVSLQMLNAPENAASQIVHNIVTIYGVAARRFLCLRNGSNVYVVPPQEVSAVLFNFSPAYYSNGLLIVLCQLFKEKS